MQANDGLAEGSPAALPERPGMVEGLLGWYTRRASLYSNRRFIVELFILSFALKVLGALPLIFVPEEAVSGDQFGDTPAGVVVVAALFAAPVLETLFFQWFLVWLTSKFTPRLTWQIGVSAVIFALFHVSYGVATAYAVLFPGIVFALAFIVKRRESRWKAFWVTAVIHALHNVVVVPFALMMS